MPLPILTPPELATLFGPPTPETAPLLETVAARWLPAPAKAFIPPDDPRYLHLGDGQRSDGSWGPIGIRYDMLRYILWVTAQMGRGKSVWLQNLYAGLMRAGAGCFFYDMKGFDLVNSLYQLTPIARERDVVVFDPGGMWCNGDDLRPAMNLLSGAFGQALGIDYDTQASTILSFFSVLDSRFDEAPAVQSFATMGMLALLEGETHATIQHLLRLYEDEDYRTALCERLTNMQVKEFWLGRFPQMSSQELTPLTAFKRRIDLLLTYPSIAAMSVAPSCSLNFRTLMDQGGIVLAGMSAKDGKIAHIIGTLLLTQLTMAALSRTNVSDAEDADGFCPARPDFIAALDEAQIVFEKNPGMAPVIFSQLRAMRIGTVVVHQNIEQLRVILGTLSGNTQSRCVLGAKEADARQYASDYGALGLRMEDVINMEKFYHQYIGLYGTDVPIYSARMRPPPSPPVRPPLRREYANWRTVRAPAHSASDARFDAAMDHFKELAAFAPQTAMMRLGQLAMQDPAAYLAYGARTQAHRHAQRAFLLEHPGCIPEQVARIQTLSALWVGVPRLETQALQWALLMQTRAAADARATRAAATPARGGRGTGARGSRQVPPLEGLVEPAPPHPDAGSGAGAAAASGLVAAAGRLPTIEELLAARGTRRPPDDAVATGFEALDAEA